jgi:hypothetical protein
MNVARLAQQCALAVALCALSGVPGQAAAQTLREQCASAQGSYRPFCENIADAVHIVQPRAGIALSGGNPVPGTASTLGMRIRSTPRVGIGLRVTAAQVDLPPVQRTTTDRDVDFPLGSVSLDATVGLYQGLTLAPTVGGFGSVDLLASVSVLPLPSGEGFDDSAPTSWALGARVGVLRESFTAPGVSVSGMYRRLGNVTFGSAALSDTDGYFRMSEFSVTSVRGVVGKRVFGIGLAGGAGYDRYASAVSGTVRDPRVTAPENTVTLTADRLRQNRTSLFGNVSFTLLILNMAAELGWQAGGDAVEGGTDKLEDRGVFGSLAIRLAI